MDKYIKAQDLIDRVYPVDPENDGSDGCTIVFQNLTLSSQEIEAIVDEIPAADVVPVVHAQWIVNTDDFTPKKRCTNCGYNKPVVAGDAVSQPPENYCPNCGAKMDGGVTP